MEAGGRGGPLPMGTVPFGVVNMWDWVVVIVIQPVNMLKTLSNGEFHGT